MNRRQFLTTSAAASLALSSGVHASAADDKKPRVGVIGCGWFGMVDLMRLMEVKPVEVVALCDVDQEMLKKKVEEVKKKDDTQKPKAYGDFREMLKNKDLDIVIVGTPDHWHPLAMIAAVEAGADVYVEKPVSVCIDEGRAMVAAARKHKKVVQVGTQRRSTPHIKEAYDFVREGNLGKIAFLKAYCYYHMRSNRDLPEQAPPKTFDFEMWTGPAPMRKYNPEMHPGTWRSYMEYCNGIVGDMCVHMLDAARWIVGKKYPKSIFSTGGILVDKKGKANTTDTQTVTFDYGDFPLVWEHRSWGKGEGYKDDWGVNFYGDKGTLQLNVNGWDFLPQGDGKPIRKDAKVEKEFKDEDLNVYPANRAHMRDFLKAIAERGKPIADIEEGHISTATCILANMSLKLGRSLTWDAEKERVVGDDEANKLMQREYRKPWVFPEV
jgi:predicted dehydrogenase